MDFWTCFPVLTSLSNFFLCVCWVKNSWNTKTKAKLGTKLSWYDKDTVSLALTSPTIKDSGVAAKGKPEFRYVVTFHNSTLQNCLFFFFISFTHPLIKCLFTIYCHKALRGNTEINKVMSLKAQAQIIWLPSSLQYQIISPSRITFFQNCDQRNLQETEDRPYQNFK